MHASYTAWDLVTVTVGRGWLQQRSAYRACSNAYARAISLGSLHAGPMKVSPTGRPETRPAGTDIAGYPDTAHGLDVPNT